MTGSIKGGEEGEAKLEVTINEPPKDGTCTAKPRKGVPCDPMFTLTCTGFTDDEEPLQYEFFYSKGKGSKNETLGSGLEPSRSRVTFPSGNLMLYAKISDSLGASKMFPFEYAIQVIHGCR